MYRNQEIVCNEFSSLRSWRDSPGGGGALGYFWVGVCRPGLQIGTPF